MKTWTVFSRSLLLVALLEVSWAAAAPRQADPGNDTPKDRMATYFEDHPDATRDLLPDLINKATTIELTVEDDVLADLIEKKAAEDGQQANHGRKKRRPRSGFRNRGSRREEGLDVDLSQHDSNNWNDWSYRDWSRHDSSQKDLSTHDLSHKDLSTHDSSHKDYSRIIINASHNNCSQSHTTSNESHTTPNSHTNSTYFGGRFPSLRDILSTKSN